MNGAGQRPEADPPGTARDRPGHGMAGWMQEIVPYGIFTTDRDLRLNSWNDWLVAHSGFPASAVVGRKLTEVFPELATRRLLDRYQRALAGEISVLSVALHKYLLAFPVTVAESGLPHMLQTARIAPVPEGPGAGGTITIIEDVTQREFQAATLSRQQEIDRLLSESLAALLQSNNPAEEMAGIFGAVRLALALDSYAGYLLTPDGRGLHLQAAAGLSPKQRAAVSLLVLSEEDRAELGQSPTPARLPRAAQAGSLHVFGMRGQGAFPLIVGERVLGLVLFGSYSREEIPPLDRQILSRIVRYVAIALDRARRERDTETASRAKDDFLAALSHELRTPLNPVLLVASDSADRPDFPPEAREAFRSIEKNALLEARLIDDLLDLTRIAHGKLGLEMLPFDVRTALRDALATVGAELREREIDLQVDLGAAAGPVVGDAARLQQVFWNVLKNAVKFTPSRGRIRVTGQLRPAANEIALSVADSGIGMEPAELARVFEAFSQGDHALKGRSHRFGGLGLGLAIGRKLVEMHGGWIEAASPGKNQGSVFTIHLPLAPAAADDPGAARAAAGLSAGGAACSDGVMPAGAKRRILLVEDHDATRLALAHLLTNRGYEVVSTGTVEQALQIAALQAFSLVLSDIGLPDGDGFALMRILREAHGLKGIALTGYGMEEDLVRSGDAGFLTHLTKPVSAQVLDRALAQAFRASDS